MSEVSWEIDWCCIEQIVLIDKTDGGTFVRPDFEIHFSEDLTPERIIDKLLPVCFDEIMYSGRSCDTFLTIQFYSDWLTICKPNGQR